MNLPKKHSAGTEVPVSEQGKSLWIDPFREGRNGVAERNNPALKGLRFTQFAAQGVPTVTIAVMPWKHWIWNVPVFCPGQFAIATCS